MADIETRLARIEALLLDISNRLPKSKPQTEEAWLTGLRNDPAYKGIDIDHELRKMDRWLEQNPGRKKTRKFIENWLLRAEKTVTVKVQPVLPKAMQPVKSLPLGEAPDDATREKLSRVLGKNFFSMSR